MFAKINYFIWLAFPFQTKPMILKWRNLILQVNKKNRVRIVKENPLKNFHTAIFHFWKTFVFRSIITFLRIP